MRTLGLGWAVLALVVVGWLGSTPRPLDARQPGLTTLTGVVIDANTGQPVPGALLSLSPSGRQAVGDLSGAYRFPDVPIGRHTLVAQRIGYLRVEMEIELDERPIPLEVRMTPDPVALDGLTVTGDGRVALGGSVSDARTGERLPWAGLWLTPDAVRRAFEAASDEGGSFSFDEVPMGSYLLGTRLVGYVTQYVPVLADGSDEPIDLLLEPDSVVLVGLPLVEAELRTRRNRSLGIGIPFASERLQNSESRHTLDFLTKQTWISPVLCERELGLCVLSGGRSIRPSIYVDDRLVCGTDALAYLSGFRPSEFYLVELFSTSRTVTVRAYTHEFIERQAIHQAERGHPLPPTLGCGLSE